MTNVKVREDMINYNPVKISYKPQEEKIAIRQLLFLSYEL